MSYDEHLISQAGGDGDPIDRLAVIEARIPKIPESALSNTEKDRAYLLALVREQQARIDRVRELHVLHEDSGKCAECTVSPYSMHSVRWPCPTIAAITATEPKP